MEAVCAAVGDEYPRVFLDIGFGFAAEYDWFAESGFCDRSAQVGVGFDFGFDVQEVGLWSSYCWFDGGDAGCDKHFGIVGG